MGGAGGGAAPAARNARGRAGAAARAPRPHRGAGVDAAGSARVGGAAGPPRTATTPAAGYSGSGSGCGGEACATDEGSRFRGSLSSGPEATRGCLAPPRLDGGSRLRGSLSRRPGGDAGMSGTRALPRPTGLRRVGAPASAGSAMIPIAGIGIVPDGPGRAGARGTEKRPIRLPTLGVGIRDHLPGSPVRTWGSKSDGFDAPVRPSPGTVRS